MGSLGPRGQWVLRVLQEETGRQGSQGPKESGAMSVTSASLACRDPRAAKEKRDQQDPQEKWA